MTAPDGGLRFDDAYLEETLLPDGTPVLFRLIRPEDRELLRRGFEALSPTSRYRRFLMAKSALSDGELRHLTEIDGWDHLAIGAGRRVGDRIEEPLGVARYVRLAGGDVVAEAAIAVVDDWQGRGLGRMLFERLAAAAWERGVRRFRVEMLAENTQMHALTKVLGPRDSMRVADGLLTAEFALPESAPDAPLESSAYRALAIAAGARG